MKIENESNFKKALSEGINLFLGSGFSILARDRKGQPLPLGGSLVSELITKFNLPANLNLSQIATILNNSAKSNLRNYLIERFTVYDFDNLYYSLNNINVASIFTTNIDNLIYKIYSDNENYYLNDLDIRGASIGDMTAIDLITLHGSVLDNSRELTFSALDIAAAFRQDPDRWHFLTEALQRRPTIFWGYSMSDSGTLESFNPATLKGRPIKDAWIMVMEETDEGTKKYFNALGLQLIVSETSELLKYFQNISVDFNNRSVEAKQSRSLFPEYSIPDPSVIPVRSLFDFYRGASPSWHEIFSGNLHKTKYHAKVRNSLSAGKDTIIVGVPASGKTTLMMQVITDFNFKGVKLVCDAPTEEKVDLIIKKLKGEPALIGIDNFADSANALGMLLKQKNVLVLACDRDYSFEITYHRIVDNDFEVIDVTELEDSDVQSLLTHIPVELRKTSSSIPRSENGRPPSLFEFVEANVVMPSLKKRFRSVLDELQSKDINLLDFLVVCSYVHSCRTPISVDMLLAYFRDSINTYDEIYEMREQIGQILTEYNGELDDGQQDYYVPRSIIVAEAVLNQARSDILKRMLNKFHKEVSTYRIHRFDIFKRRAYDADLMKRAFKDWEEGLNFYKDLLFRDNSPFILQQAALYLAHKRRYTEAFSMIDEALIISERKIPSIRNSHAIILFNANINRNDTDGTVKRTLQESMGILETCYLEDRRKAYHAITYADQALLYDERFGRRESEEYLHSALEWLKKEKESSPWNRNVKRLYKVVEKRLTQ